MKSVIKKIIKAVFPGLLVHEERVDRKISINRLLLGRMASWRVAEQIADRNLRDVEFKVFSQNGEDGIIQHLINHIPIENQVFIEFGVSDYKESNTRFLLENDLWRGLVLDGNEGNVDSIRSDPYFWSHNLVAECHFITKDNINAIITNAGFDGDIGLLSIDVDGNDFWIWEAIDVVQPRIVICEYNSVFGCDLPISIPYDEKFDREKAHFSCLYFGASLPALCTLAEKKGYDFVGSDRSGVNAFFVRSDIPHGLKKVSAKEGYVRSNSRESRDQHGRLSYVSGDARLELIRDMSVENVSNGEMLRLK